MLRIANLNFRTRPKRQQLKFLRRPVLLLFIQTVNHSLTLRRFRFRRVFSFLASFHSPIRIYSGSNLYLIFIKTLGSFIGTLGSSIFCSLLWSKNSTKTHQNRKFKKVQIVPCFYHISTNDGM